MSQILLNRSFLRLLFAVLEKENRSVVVKTQTPRGGPLNESKDIFSTNLLLYARLLRGNFRVGQHHPFVFFGKIFRENDVSGWIIVCLKNKGNDESWCLVTHDNKNVGLSFELFKKVDFSLVLKNK